SFEVNGNRVAYSSDRIAVAQRQIYTISIFGGTETRVTTSSTDDSSPAYSPDGTLIAFARAGTGIYTTGTGGSGETPITAGADTNPDWQPGAPLNSSLPTISGSSSQGSLLTASPGSFSSASSYEYQWLRCNGPGDTCSDIPGETAQTYRVTSDDVGSSFRVRVTAVSASGSSSATSEATPVIVGPQPRNIVPPKVVVPGTTGIPVAGVALSSSVGTWTGAGTLTYTYQWKKCQPKDGPCYKILLTSAQNTTFVPTADLIGWSLRVEVTATNSAGSATEQSESTPLVIGNPPVAVVRPKISVSTTNPTVGQELTVDTGSWTAFGLSFTYQWRRCDAPGTLPSCVPIAGASTSTYTTTEADLGLTLRVYVTASGIGGAATAFSDHTFPTIPAPRFAPSMSAAPSITGDAEIGGTLTATRGTWVGFAPIRYVSTWQRCDATLTVCKAVTTVTGLVYKVTAADIGWRIRLSVVAANSIGSLRGRSEATEPIVLGQPKPKGRRIVGTSGPDYIPGGGGDDVLSGLGGHDTITGGKGNDRILGGDGNDYIDGGLGEDTIDGGAGSDTILVADGKKDIVDCGDGNDRVVSDSIDVVTNCEATSAPTPPTTPEPPVPPTKP
ncbi:MAG: hypothetical protein WKF60_14220, partial [Ilumatobacter sp.]